MLHHEVHVRCPGSVVLEVLGEQPAGAQPWAALCPQSHDQEGCPCHGELLQFPEFLLLLA